jgi:hypothetical protein
MKISVDIGTPSKVMKQYNLREILQRPGVYKCVQYAGYIIIQQFLALYISERHEVELFASDAESWKKSTFVEAVERVSINFEND